MSTNDAQYWQQRYEQGQDPWELNNPHKHLSRIFEVVETRKLVTPNTKVLIPGCGRGSCAAEFARQGYDALGIDFAAAAISDAQKMHKDLKPKFGSLRFKCEDFFKPSFKPGEFGMVYNRAMLCALPLELHALYLTGCTEALAKDGLLTMITFSDVGVLDLPTPIPGKPSAPPPWPLSFEFIREQLEPSFYLEHWEEFDYNGSYIRTEAVSIWRKK